MLRSMSVAGAMASLALGAASAQAARDYSSLYSDATLAYWQKRYAPNIDYNYRTLLLPALSPAERLAAAGMVLDMPLRDGADPFAYYARGSQITISTLSIKFLDDLATASAWLEAHKYQQGTIPYYVAVLKYRQPRAFASGAYPAPLAALGIPDNALSEQIVDDDAQKVLKGSIVFILSHEIGHVVHEDLPSGDASQQPRELAADKFAVDMFRRIGAPPGGITTFFLAASHFVNHRGDYQTQAAFDRYMQTGATHPLSGARLRALAAELRRDPEDFVRTEPDAPRALRAVRTMAAQLDTLAPLFDDPLLQRYSAVVGREIPLAELRPRTMTNIWIPKVTP